MVTQSVDKGDTVKLYPNAYYKVGYEFTGWEDDMGHRYKDQDYIAVKSDVKLYAQWTKADNDTPNFNPTDIKEILNTIIQYQTLRGLDADIKPNKWYNVGGNYWYYINSDLSPQRGWLQDNDRKYYLDIETGLMITGWRVIDGYYYYFAEEAIPGDYQFDKVTDKWVTGVNKREVGQMYYDEFTPDGRYVDYSGRLIKQYK